MGRKTVISALLLVVAAVAIYLCWPRRPDLRAFDPAGMARLETAMWRDYYEKHYPRLFWHLYEVSRMQFGFAPLDSLRIALSVAGAAKTFQPTRSRAAADAALPSLALTTGCCSRRRRPHSTSTRPRASNSTGGRRGARKLP